MPTSWVSLGFGAVAVGVVVRGGQLFGSALRLSIAAAGDTHRKVNSDLLVQEGA